MSEIASKLEQDKSKADDASAKVYIENTKFAFEAMERNYKKFIEDLQSKRPTKSEFKDIEKEILACIDFSKSNNDYGKEIMQIHDLDKGSKILYLKLTDYYSKVIDFAGKSFSEKNVLEKVQKGLSSDLQDIKAEFDECFGMKDEIHRVKALSQLYFANGVFSDVANLSKKKSLYQVIDAVKQITTEIAAESEMYDKEKGAVYQAHVTANKSLIIELTGVSRHMVGSLYASINSALLSLHNRKEALTKSDSKEE